MKSAIAITVEGVLMKPVNSGPIAAGLLLYHGLASVATVILLTEYTPDKEMDHWLLMNNLTRHAQVVYFGETRLMQANRLRQQGYALEMVIDPDPANVAMLVKEGYNSVHFLHAEYAVPSWRPDYEMTVKPWDEIAAQVANQAYMRARDGRLTRTGEED